MTECQPSLLLLYEKYNFEQGSEEMAWAALGGSTCSVTVSGTTGPGQPLAFCSLGPAWSESTGWVGAAAIPKKKTR